MLEWLSDNGGMIVLPVFMGIFFAFGFWAYRPKNKEAMDKYGEIPLRDEGQDGEK